MRETSLPCPCQQARTDSPFLLFKITNLVFLLVMFYLVMLGLGLKNAPRKPSTGRSSSNGSVVVLKGSSLPMLQLHL